MRKIDGLISIARKAGYAIIGQDNLKIYDKKLYLLVIDKTAGNSLKRELDFISQKRNIPLFEIENLGVSVGIENCKAVGFKNKQFSDKIMEILKGE